MFLNNIKILKLKKNLILNEIIIFYRKKKIMKKKIFFLFNLFK
jgi:hypothetical protein